MWGWEEERKEGKGDDSTRDAEERGCMQRQSEECGEDRESASGEENDAATSSCCSSDDCNNHHNTRKGNAIPIELRQRSLCQQQSAQHPSEQKPCILFSNRGEWEECGECASNDGYEKRCGWQCILLYGTDDSLAESFDLHCLLESRFSRTFGR